MKKTEQNSKPNVTEIFEKCVGCKWTLHVLGQIRQGVCRPGQLERTADGLTTKVLNERLVKLVRFDILEKTSHPEIPPRVEYTLTTFGERFVQILDQVERLQDEYQQYGTS
ncbi:MAG: helix-turn-helix transcriptional regulator [bacterium]|nr:helix-turn-helix transcriptional regulator [bacterium]